MKMHFRSGRLLPLLAAAALATAVAAGSARAATSYADLPGDAGAAADIGAVSVTNAPDGQLTFQIAVPNQPELASDARILLLLDTDMNASTGLQQAGGADYAFLLDGETRSYGLARWDGSTFVDAPSSTVTVSYASGAYISVNRSELGGTSNFEFWVRAIQGTEASDGHFDDAPDGYMWQYLLSVGQSGSYADPAGDSGTASDIGTVSVSNNEAGQLAFEITTNHPGLAADDTVLMALDTDQNPATGDTEALGAEYLYVLDGERQSYALGAWDGSRFDFAAPQSTTKTWYANGVAFTVNRSELGGTSGFNFAIRTAQGPAPGPGQFDAAPDAGTWSYQLASAPALAPPRATAAAPLQLSVVRVFAKPAAPVPGALFTVFAQVRRSDTGDDLENGTVTCKATVGRRAVAVAQAGFLKGTPDCAFRIPQKTKGKILRGSITVVAEGARAVRAFSYRVGAPKRRTAGVTQAWRVSAQSRLTGVDLRGHALAGGLAVEAADVPWSPSWLGPAA